MIIIMLFFRFLIFDLFVMVIGAKSDYCQTSSNTASCRTTTSGYKLKDPDTQKYLVGVDILSLVFVLFSIGYCMLFRKLLFKLREYARGDQFCDKNFTILVEKIPPFFFKEDTPIEEATYNYHKMIQEGF
jgi:hypothetical protein